MCKLLDNIFLKLEDMNNLDMMPLIFKGFQTNMATCMENLF